MTSAHTSSHRITSMNMSEDIRNCCSSIVTPDGSVSQKLPQEVAMGNGSLEDMYDMEIPSAVVVINTISIIFGVLSILLNIIFLLATRFLKDRGTAYNRFMINLSISDIMSSLTFLLIHNWPRGPFANIDFHDDFYLLHALPYLFRSAPWMFLTSYLLTLTCLTMNQYIAVCKPWRYSALVTGRTVKVALLCVWLLSSLQVFIPLAVLLGLNCLSDKQDAINKLFYVSMVEMQVWMGFYALSSLFNILLNLIVYRRIRMLKLKRRRSHVSNPEIANIRMKQDAFVTVTLLLMACFFCRLPFPLMGIVGISLVTEGIDMNTYLTINSGIVLLLYLNCFADPIIYMLRTKELRKSYRCLGAYCALPCCGKPDQLSTMQSMPLTSVSSMRQNCTVTETESTILNDMPNESVQS